MTTLPEDGLQVGSVVPPAGDAPDDEDEERIAAMLCLPDPDSRRGWILKQVVKRKPKAERRRLGY